MVAHASACECNLGCEVKVTEAIGFLGYGALGTRSRLVKDCLAQRHRLCEIAKLNRVGFEPTPEDRRIVSDPD